MAKVGVSEAARLAGITRATMYSHIKSGRLSAERLPDDSGYAIDTAELARVYQTLNTPVTPQTAPDTEAMQREIGHLRAQLKAKEELVAEKTARIADLQAMVRTLEHQAPPALEKENHVLRQRLHEVEVERRLTKEKLEKLEIERSRQQYPRRTLWSRIFGGAT